MDLNILSLSKSVAHIPEKTTYAIRIFNSNEAFAHIFNLQNSEKYIWVDSYRFDDNEAHGRQSWPISINQEIASEIILNFMKYRYRIESLLVHCTKWENRSPSVAIALNEMFWLWHDSYKLLAKYPDHNRLVYMTLRKTWEILGIKTQ